jgi:hypothetical protein
MTKVAYIGQHLGFDTIEYIAREETVRIALDDGREILIDCDGIGVSLGLDSFRGDNETSHLTVNVGTTRLFVPFAKSEFKRAYAQVEQFTRQWESQRGQISKRPARKPRASRRRESVN